MTIGFYIWTKVGKLLANVVAACIPDREQRHKVRRRLDPLNPERCVAYLEKHYTDVSPIAPNEQPAVQSPIWVCWLQGLEQAPQLVVNCIKSIERYKQEEQQLIVVTADNYADYVDLPATIIEKWKKGLITNTHFSDLFRIHALTRHGGCWIDATCLLTAPVPDSIRQSDLFLFRSHGEFAYTFIQSCFMVSGPNSYVMRKWCAAMDAYWEQENRLVNYFTLHLMFIALQHRDKMFSDAFAQVPAVSDDPMHILLYAMMRGDDYTKELAAQANQATFIQKLTYKYPANLLENKCSVASYFSKQINDGETFD